MQVGVQAEAAVAPVRRPWRDPFVVAFVVGALALTVLPHLQRLALDAPAPLAAPASWALRDAGSGGEVSASALRGKVWLATFAPAGCDAACLEAVDTLAGAARYLSDLGDAVALVTFVNPAAWPAVRGRAGDAAAAVTWHRLTGDGAALAGVQASFAGAWARQGGGPPIAREPSTGAFLRRPTLAVVDQDGAIRGFWPADEGGRGNAINAARMFVRHGTEP